jgi:alkanesulfonate monooxygenase SsuD/methylene tetrahydromethanopterin reductase-like flavin-dependent oxidoreductase (luciferase family)
MEFEALVPVGRWRGFGGVTNFNGAGFECFSWAAGIGASTKYPAIFATSHVPTVHPIMAAKQGAAIDHITNGRFVLNVVTGWNMPEIEMFGVDLLDHETRYERAAEWLTIIRRLWTEDDEFDFDGRFYQIKKGYIAPKPIQRPHPVIMNAGGSDTGRAFAARHADVSPSSTSPRTISPEVKARMDAYRRDAREAQGTTSRSGPIATWCRARPRRRLRISRATTSTRTATGRRRARWSRLWGSILHRSRRRSCTR